MENEMRYQINYAPLWKLMIDRRMMVRDLSRQTKISHQTLAKMKKTNCSVTLETLLRICTVLQCRIEDVVVFERVK